MAPYVVMLTACPSQFPHVTRSALRDISGADFTSCRDSVTLEQIEYDLVD